MTITVMFDLHGKVAVVTGGAALGFDMAGVRAEAGCDVVIASRQLDHAEAAAKKLRDGRDRDVLPLALDVSGALGDCDIAHTANDIDRVVKWRGRSDVSDLAGKPLRLRVVFRNTDLYAFEFR